MSMMGRMCGDWVGRCEGRQVQVVRLSPSLRITTGLVSLMVGLFLGLDLLFGLLPDSAKTTKEIREKVSMNLAVQLTSLIQTGDRATLRITLFDLVAHDKDMLSVAVRDADGNLIAQAGNHSLHWIPPKDGRPTLSNISVPFNAGNGHSGSIEISYRSPLTTQGVKKWLQNPVVSMTLAIAVAGSAFFYLYIRRALQYLDPSKVIPERVRGALDTLTEGVMILDLKGRIMLVNKAFEKLHAKAGRELLGHRASDLDWLNANLDRDTNKHPWSRVLRDNNPVTRESIGIPQENGELRKLLVNVAPIFDDRGKSRGCLTTFDDTTLVERMNDDLLQLVEDLQASQAKIEMQNEELQILANHDQLTGCLNRRAFFERGEKVFEDAHKDGLDLCCIMTDIDHFKSVNDTYGHPVGDQVIKLVARILQSSVRPSDLVCRYGGEEFCVLLPGLSMEGAAQIAERIRGGVEENCGRGVRTVEGMRVTSSFGVSSNNFGGKTLAELISQADQALYGAKRGGRNQVFLFSECQNSEST